MNITFDHASGNSHSYQFTGTKGCDPDANKATRHGGNDAFARLPPRQVLQDKGPLKKDTHDGPGAS